MSRPFVSSSRDALLALRTQQQGDAGLQADVEKEQKPIRPVQSTKRGGPVCGMMANDVTRFYA